ncbi:uncharacterized protein LOC132759935 isoform X3 [Ruditapes philippinarum]|uniref:uncharacterized protein LOC132759935 isoform X3 n=1 Tax=Ruditapes philippinarum TaxID=129788 RepID=UPI00295B759C|nr:uncharacterized protein LOC132759935 isoform X3 [Ruditapes philippinarum]
MIMKVLKNTTCFIILLLLLVIAVECRSGGGGRGHGGIRTSGGGNGSIRGSGSSGSNWWIYVISFLGPVVILMIISCCIMCCKACKGTNENLTTTRSQRILSLPKTEGHVPKQYQTQRSKSDTPSDRVHRPQEHINLSTISGAYQIQDRKTLPSYPQHTVVKIHNEPLKLPQTKRPYQQKRIKHNASFML